MTLRFVHDQFSWEDAGRRFLLMEPPTLFGDDPPDRVAVQAWRHTEGWVPVSTHRFDHSDRSGVVDLGSHSNDLADSSPTAADEAETEVGNVGGPAR